jgi:hypothetical protein
MGSRMNFDEQADKSATELTESEKQMAHERTALRAAVIHEAIRAEGEGELARPLSALTWSGRRTVAGFFADGNSDPP